MMEILSKFLNSQTSKKTLASLLILSVLGCANAPASSSDPTKASTPDGTTHSELPPQQIGDTSDSEEQTQTTANTDIIDGYYAMGGTDQGLEVRGQQYRYYDEGGEYEWRPISQLTAIGSDQVFDGENYWCHSDAVPEGGGVCTASGWLAYGDVGSLSSSELSLGGVASGASEAEVIRQLGQPDQIDQDSPFSTRFTYQGLSISFLEDAALNLRSVSADYCTPSGLCPGDAVSKAESLYGAPLLSPRAGADYWQYINTDSACTMELEVTNETIGAIALSCLV